MTEVIRGAKAGGVRAAESGGMANRQVTAAQCDGAVRNDGAGRQSETRYTCQEKENQANACTAAYGERMSIP